MDMRLSDKHGIQRYIDWITVDEKVGLELRLNVRRSRRTAELLICISTVRRRIPDYTRKHHPGRFTKWEWFVKCKALMVPGVWYDAATLHRMLADHHEGKRVPGRGEIAQRFARSQQEFDVQWRKNRLNYMLPREINATTKDTETSTDGIISTMPNICASTRDTSAITASRNRGWEQYINGDGA